MDLGEFLVENQSFMAPVIEWGGLLLLLFITLSPFLIIRHRIFKPTRWWHIVGAYLGSFVILFIFYYILDRVDQWLLENYFNTVDLYGAFSEGTYKATILSVLIYPFLVFYSVKLLYKSFTRKRFWLSTLAAILLLVAIIIAGGYVAVYLVGQALTGNL